MDFSDIVLNMYYYDIINPIVNNQFKLNMKGWDKFYDDYCDCNYNSNSSDHDLTIISKVINKF
jgi:hypothetical protein